MRLKHQSNIIFAAAISAAIAFIIFVFSNEESVALIAKYKMNHKFVIFSVGLLVLLSTFMIASRWLKSRNLPISLVILVTFSAAFVQIQQFKTVNKENSSIFELGRPIDFYTLARVNLSKVMATELGSVVALSKLLEGVQLIMPMPVTDEDRFLSYVISGKAAKIIPADELPVGIFESIEKKSLEDYEFFTYAIDGSRGAYLQKYPEKKDVYYYIPHKKSIYIK